MGRQRNQKKNRRFPHEETWLRNFVGYHGTEGVTRFSERDLNGVALVVVIEALAGGTVIVAEKCDGPGSICLVEYHTEEGVVITVQVRFSSNEDLLEILNAEERKESTDEPDNAA